MSLPVLVRGESSIWLTVGRITGPVLVVVGLILVEFDVTFGWFVMAGGVILAAGLEIYAAIERSQRTWVTDREEMGFDVQTRKGTVTWRDDQISAMALESERKLANGEISGYKRTFSVWVEGEAQPVVMENTIKLNHEDPLHGLINRLIGSFAARMDGQIEQGGAVSGDGWRLDRNSFIYGPPAQQEQVSLAAITAVEPFERSMCLWQQGRDDAFCRVPLKSRNAYLLPILIGPRMKNREERPEETSASGLGRILFEKKPAATWPPLCVLTGVVAIIIGIGLVIAYAQEPLETPLLFVGIGLMPVGIGCFVGAVAMKKMNFRCHERGVYKASLFGDNMLAYKDVATFTYSAVRHYHNGAYVGTHLSLKFDPQPGSGASPISYSTTVQATDDDLDELKDTISGILAENMIQQLATNQIVPWTTNLTFQREGIQYRPAGWVSRGEPQFMKYDDYGGYNVDQGVFYLYLKGQQKPITNEQISAPNFFPGFVMLLRMLHVKE